MLKMVDGTGIIGVDMVCPLGVSTPQPPNYDRVEMEGTGILVLPNSLDAPLERLELGGKTEQVQTSGKNLLNSNIYVQGYLASIDTGQKISLNTEVKSFTTTMDINALQGKSISISIRTKGNSGKKYAFTDEKDVIINGKFDAGMADYSEYNNIQVPQNAKKFYFSVTYEVQENTKLQLEYGNKATSYEPYTGGKPSPSPEYPQEIKSVGKWNEETRKYEVSVKVTGKNLLNTYEKGEKDSEYYSVNEDGSLNQKKTDNRSFLTVPATLFLKAGKYYFTLFNSGITFQLYDADANAVLLVIEKQESVLVDLKKDTNIKYKVYNSSGTANNVRVMVSTNKEVDYVPCKEPQSLTITSDRPITKWDKLVEQGGQIGWLYQSKIAYLTGEEEWKSSLNAFYTTTYNFLKNNAAKCSHYVLGGIVNQEKNNIFSIGEGAYTNSLWIRDTSFSAVQDFKAHLSDLIEKGTPIMVVSSAAETEFVPLPQSEQNAIRALKTYYPTTVITADGGKLDPDIKVTYRKEI